MTSTFINQDKYLLNNFTSTAGSEAVKMQETHEMLSSKNILCQNPDGKKKIDTKIIHARTSSTIPHKEISSLQMRLSAINLFMSQEANLTPFHH